MIVVADGFDAAAAVHAMRERPARSATPARGERSEGARRERGAPAETRPHRVASGERAEGTRRERGAQTESRPNRVASGERTTTATGRVRREPAATGSERRDAASHGDARRAEREAAYAKNPDQPPVKRTPANGDAAGTPAHPHAHIHAARKVKPVPALLMKRKDLETEKA